MVTRWADDLNKKHGSEMQHVDDYSPHEYTQPAFIPHSTNENRIKSWVSQLTREGNYMAIEMTDEMMEHVDNNQANRKPCILATAGKDGWPSMGFRASMMAFDKDHLAFWERSNKDGLSHMQENPQVLVMYRDPEARVAFKFYGHVTIHESGEMRESVWERTVQPEKDADPEKKGCAVVIDIDKITAYGGAVLQER